MHTQQFKSGLVHLRAHIELLFCRMPSLGGVTASMTRMIGYRRFIGVTHFHNQRWYEIIKKLMMPLGQGGKQSSSAGNFACTRRPSIGYTMLFGNVLMQKAASDPCWATTVEGGLRQALVANRRLLGIWRLIH